MFPHIIQNVRPTKLCISTHQIDRKSDKSYRRLLHEQMQLKKQIKSYRELTDEELLEMEASPAFGKTSWSHIIK